MTSLPTTTMTMTTTTIMMIPTTTTRESQLWDLIETWGFHEDIKDINADADDANYANENDDKKGNDDKGISALGLDRDMGFLT